MSMSRRELMLAGALFAPAVFGQAPTWQLPRATVDATALARDEAWWSKVAAYYDSPPDVLNLEHGYWGKMARPVEDYYLEATRRVNRELSVYARKDWYGDLKAVEAKVAAALGVEADEITLTRNATEGLQDLVRQYRGLAQGGAVLFADVDYPDFKPVIQWLGEQASVRVVRLALPAQSGRAELLAQYTAVMQANPDLKLMLLTHTSNQHGMTLPVREIAAAARARGIDVICDCAQSWGLLDYTLPQLGVDWAVFNLHKWIGAPLGVGALYMRRGSLARVAPNPAERDTATPRVAGRVHMGTVNFAAMLAVPPALAFHADVGGAAKEQRLRYLQRCWTEPAAAMAHIEVLGGQESASQSGMGGFRLRGERSVDAMRQVQQRLEKESGIFTVMRDGLADGANIRVTPQVFTTPADMARFVAALRALA